MLDANLRVRADLLGHVQAPAGEHRQAPEQDLLVLGQQLEAPVDRSLQCLLPRRSRAIAGCQQPESVIDPVSDLVDRQCPDARGRQLDRQRNPVQRPAELDHLGAVLPGQCEPGPHCRSPVDEQADGFVLGSGRELVAVRKRAAGDSVSG